MKKYMILLASAMIFAACNNDEPEMWNGEIRLTTTNLLQTRATQDIQRTQFDADESVNIILRAADADGNAVADDPYTLDGYNYTADGSGNLSIDSAPTYPTTGYVNIYGLYPSGIEGVGAYIDDSSTDMPIFTIQTDQSTDANYMASDLMIGYPDTNSDIPYLVQKQADAIPMVFQHLLTKININLTMGTGLTADSLTNATVTILNTFSSCSFEFTDMYAEVITSTGATAPPTITAGVVDALTDGTYSCSAIIVPQYFELPDQTSTLDFIQITLDSGTVLTYKLTANSTLSFDAGTEYTYAITVNRLGLDVTTSITDWTAAEAIAGEATN